MAAAAQKGRCVAKLAAGKLVLLAQGTPGKNPFVRQITTMQAKEAERSPPKPLGM